MPKKKKFIDKKNSVTFHLVHRSQQDPEQSERVLLPDEATAKRAVHLQEEQIKCGIYYDDDYDYLKHLKRRDEFYENTAMANEPSEIIIKEKSEPVRLPSEVFESLEQTEPGLLNEQYSVKGPRPDWDPDIVEALDDDFDYENPTNQLDDDFMVEANAGVSEDEDGQYDDHNESSKHVYFDGPERSGYDSDNDSCGNFRDSDDGEMNFSDEETKSRFTEYSMTSSVMNRNKGLTLIDDRFETLYEQYDDEEIGALDQDEIEGNNRNTEQMLLDIAMKDYGEQCIVTKLKDVLQTTSNIGRLNLDDSDSDGDLDQLVDIPLEMPKEKWDCESILSTYSTLYNHPSVISERIQRERKERPEKLQVESPAVLSHTANVELDTYRPRDESKEDKKLRKAAVKEHRKIRRTEKKTNKNTFKKEELKLIREQNLLKKSESFKMN